MGKRIGIEVSALAYQNLTGIGRVIYHYLTELQKLDQDNEYFLYSNKPVQNIELFNPKWTIRIDSDHEKQQKNGQKKFLKSSFYILLKLPFLLKKDKIDIFIGTSPEFFPLFFRHNLTKIHMVYDIVWKLFPETVHRNHRLVFRLFARRNMKKADILIALSDTTRKEIEQRLSIRKKAFTIHLAADRNIFYPATNDQIQSIRTKYNINRKYILSISTIEPRKNLEAICRSFSLLKNRDNYQLVLAGRIGWINRSFFSLFKKYKIEQAVVLPGYIPDNDLAPLYSGAELFVYPSLYEGFGLPPLEAMQCGTPVIVSDIEAHREVVEGGGLLIDTKNIEDFAGKIDAVLDDEDLRDNLRMKGLERATKFSWEKSAAELYRIIMNQLA